MKKRPRILIVDDDPTFLKVNALFLEQAGYEVLTARDGREGLALAKAERPDVAVIDVIMRRPDEGFALARAIRADAELARTKMVVLTAAGRHYGMLFEPDETWLPVEKVLEKPIGGEELAAEIAALIAPAKDSEAST